MGSFVVKSTKQGIFPHCVKALKQIKGIMQTILKAFSLFIIFHFIVLFQFVK